QPAPDSAPLHLDLLLTGTAARADAAHLAVVVVGADQPGQEVAELGGLDLEATLAGPGMLREDVQDQLGPVHHADAELLLEVALLTRAQVLVADDQVVAQLLAAVADLGHLAATHEQAGLDLVAPLHLARDHVAAGGTGQLGELP